MRILSIMCDMVRPNILDFDNASKGDFEDTLIKLGGTYFNNCFSPGPDTGRSMGCYWSGMNPQDNGCDTRAKYPKFYLKTSSFLDILKQENYDFYFFTNPNEKVLGDLPAGYEEIGIHNEDLDLNKFLKRINVASSNIYAHIFLTDFHWALDDYGANGEGVETGLRILSESLQMIFNVIDPSEFDYILIFSDHGFKYNIEFASQGKHLLLNRDRSNTLMFIHKKGERAFNTNTKLCSIIDVYPTIMEMIGSDYSGYGYSLFSTNEHEYIIAEDHCDFLPRVNQNIEIWAVIKKNSILFRTYYDYYKEDNSDFDIDKKEFDRFLCDKSASFSEAFKQLNILELYKVMANDKSYYTNGEPRYIIKKFDVIKRIKRKINQNTKRPLRSGSEIR